MKRTAEETSAQQAGARRGGIPRLFWAFPLWSRSEAGLPGLRDTGPRHTHPIPPLASAREEVGCPGPALGISPLPSLPAAPQPASLLAAQ